MKIWFAAALGLVIASLKLVVVGLFGVTSFSTFIETLVFALSFIACIKFMAASQGPRYFIWSMLFLASVLSFSFILDFLFTNKSFSTSAELEFFGRLLLDYAAGALFGLTYRWWIKHRLLGPRN